MQPEPKCKPGEHNFYCTSAHKAPGDIEVMTGNCFICGKFFECREFKVKQNEA